MKILSSLLIPAAVCAALVALAFWVGYTAGHDAGAKGERQKLIDMLQGLKMKPWDEL